MIRSASFALCLAVTGGLAVACGGDRPLRVVPEHGRQSGGEAVRIEGDGFVGHGAPVVYFGDRAAKMVVVESPWLVTAITPQTEDPRTVDVLLHFQDGTELELPQAFTYEEEQGIVLQPEIGGG